ncbi:hypothetical protein M0Q97_12850 [Candidatus Dojkabacteria bacterium]|nr:hypothetical protein [Candidatus Dojkabacteria bacterium]
MKHLKFFESNHNKILLCSIVHDNDNTNATIFAFYDEESRNNFLINYIHKDFYDADDDSVKNIFDVDELIELFNNTDGDDRIFLDTAEILSNVELEPKLKIRKNAKKYNI